MVCDTVEIHISRTWWRGYISGQVTDMKAGQRFVLPYDRWAMDQDPPKRGTTLLLIPSQWVRGIK